MARLDASMDRLEAATAAMVGLRGRLEAGEPWPLADVYGAEPEASWGPREVLAHVGEMVPYWLGEMERVVDGATAGHEPIPFGRSATDATRIGIIGRDRTLPLRELFARLRSDTTRMSERARELSDGEAARRGTHPRLGEMTAAEMLDRFVVTHMEEHVTQLESILSEAGR